MTHREILRALSGLMLGIFVALLASTVVSSSLPKIIGDLGGTQASFTWVITATLLATTVSTPVWGKLADLTNRKMLVQLALIIFTLGSILAGLSQSSSTLIACRVLQGLGAGGLTALVQVVMSDILSPRERGKYMGLLGAITAIPTIAGPLIGGVITDTIGWRWNFYVSVPFAVVAIVLLQRTLHLPTTKRKVRIDYLGTIFVASGVSLLLIWISLAGDQFAWGSSTSYIMVTASLLLIVAAVITETQVAEPLIPPSLFKNKTLVLSVIASAAIGIVLFGTSVFLSQYMQLARGKSPTESGLLTIPMIVGTLVSSAGIGRIITRTGVWKRYVVTGTVITTVGTALMGTVRYDTNFVFVGLYMLLIGLGVGAVMQNLVLIVQNTVSVHEIGAASSTVSFFRSLGGAVGVAGLGAVLAHQVGSKISEKVEAAGIVLPTGQDSRAIPDLATMPGPVQIVIESSYGEAIGDMFLVAAPFMLIAIVATALLPNRELGNESGIQKLAKERPTDAGLAATPSDPTDVPPTPDLTSVDPTAAIAPTSPKPTTHPGTTRP
jgi:EmrB/QacA subfamily drug resistance transporter